MVELYKTRRSTGVEKAAFRKFEWASKPGQNVWTVEQRQIISSSAVHTVVFAAPGSGKTTVLTGRMAHLIEGRQAAAKSMMAMTFTRQSALDMKRRLKTLSRLPATTVEAIQMGTFHAQIFRMMLMSTPDIPVLLSRREQYGFMSSALRSAGQARQKVEDWLNHLARVKAQWPSLPQKGSVKRVIDNYESLKKNTHIHSRK